jgi:hypothetical protein
VAVSERCNAPKNCHEVFDRLSDAVLADAVELYTRTDTTLRTTTFGGSQDANPDDLSGAMPNVHDLNNASMNDQTSQNALLTVDSALRDCFSDLRYISEASWGDDAILQLGMDWLDDIDARNDFPMSAYAMSSSYNA